MVWINPIIITGGKNAECNIAEYNRLGFAHRVSNIVLLINELGHSGQLDIRRALINGTCTKRENKALAQIPAIHNKVHFVKLLCTLHASATFTSRRQGGLAWS